MWYKEATVFKGGMQAASKDMGLVSKDGARVQAKLASVPQEARKLLQRAGSSKEDVASPPQPKLTDNCTASVLAGIVHGVIVMMSFGSFAIVIFGQSEHEELRSALAIGVSQQVLSASLLIGLLTFTGFFPFTMGGPTPPAALLIADVVRSVVDNVTESEKKVPTALLTIALVSILMGLMLMLISATKTSVYALQLPYPVLCGFLGSVGVLLMRNSFSILLNIKLKWTFIPVDWDEAQALDPVGVICQLGLGLLVAAILLQGVPRVRAKMSKRAGIYVLPTLFIIPLVAFYAAIVGGDLDIGLTSELRTMSPPWLSKAEQWTWAPKDFFSTMYNVTKWDLSAVFSAESILRMLLSAMLCVIAALINMAGIEANAPQAHSLDLDKEFMSLGRANLLVGLLGGHPGHHVAAFTLPMKKDGGSTKIAPWTASSLWFLAFITAAPLSMIIPRFFFGGCFLQVGFGLARTFLWDNRKGLDTASIIISCSTVVVAIFTDLNIASGAGFMLVAFNFIRLSMSVTVVRAVERADMKRAPVYRTGRQLEALKIHGHKCMVLYLEGYLFWGTVDEITGAFEELIDGTDDDPEIIYVDLRYVTGIELSVINTFKKLQRLAGGVGIKIKLCSLPSKDTIGPGLSALLSALPFACKEDLCTLIEKCEDDILDAWMANSPSKVYTNRRTSTRTKSIVKLAVMEAKDHEESSAAAIYWRHTCFKAMRNWSISVKTKCRLCRTHEKHEHLEELVDTVNATYGIRWETVHGDLVPGQSFLPEWRAEMLVKASLTKHSQVRTYVSASAQFTVCLDDADSKKDTNAAGLPLPTVPTFDADNFDILGQAWAAQKAYLCDNVQQLPHSVYNRTQLASQFGIKKIVFIPADDGAVIEVGVHAPSSNQYIAPVQLPDRPSDLADASYLKRVLNLPARGEVEDTYPSCKLGKRLSWNLCFSISTLGTFKMVTHENPVLEEPNACVLGVGKEAEAEYVYLVLEGIFATFIVAEGEKELILKSPPGTIIGADDVWAWRPRTVQIECLSEQGQVVALSRKRVKALELGSSPFVSPRASEEFIDYMKREMSLNISIMNATFRNPEK